MADLADLYPDFAAHWIETSAGRLFARAGGSGPPLLLLHGYPQSNVMWHKIAPALAARFSLVIPDLPGYGWSAAPRPARDHSPYSKRAMGMAMVELMERLGHARFSLIGHDRGGRVGYRLALDQPGRLKALAVLDIVPTRAMWQGMDEALAFRAWHWPFLALPAPFPETLIGKDPVYFIDFLLERWSGSGDLTRFDVRALAHYRAACQDPFRIHAMCEDYRAGHTTDVEDDAADRDAGKLIDCPLLVLWGSKGLPNDRAPLATWREWAKTVRGQPIDSGHYLPEENPDATSRALLEFFTSAG